MIQEYYYFKKGADSTKEEAVKFCNAMEKSCEYQIAKKQVKNKLKLEELDARILKTEAEINRVQQLKVNNNFINSCHTSVKSVIELRFESEKENELTRLNTEKSDIEVLKKLTETQAEIVVDAIKKRYETLWAHYLTGLAKRRIVDIGMKPYFGREE